MVEIIFAFIFVVVPFIIAIPIKTFIGKTATLYILLAGLGIVTLSIIAMVWISERNEKKNSNLEK